MCFLSTKLWLCFLSIGLRLCLLSIELRLCFLSIELGLCFLSIELGLCFPSIRLLEYILFAGTIFLFLRMRLVLGAGRVWCAFKSHFWMPSEDTLACWEIELEFSWKMVNWEGAYYNSGVVLSTDKNSWESCLWPSYFFLASPHEK